MDERVVGCVIGWGIGLLAFFLWLVPKGLFDREGTVPTLEVVGASLVMVVCILAGGAVGWVVSRINGG